MKFSLFRRGPKNVAVQNGQNDAEKLLAQGFRMLSHLCKQVADMLETQRLERSGYKDQGKFLERLDAGGRASGARPPSPSTEERKP